MELLLSLLIRGTPISQAPFFCTLLPPLVLQYLSPSSLYFVLFHQPLHSIIPVPLYLLCFTFSCTTITSPLFHYLLQPIPPPAFILIHHLLLPITPPLCALFQHLLQPITAPSFAMFHQILHPSPLLLLLYFNTACIHHSSFICSIYDLL